MVNIQILRLEINYFLQMVQVALGKESIGMLITFFFTFENEDFCIDYIYRLENYINKVSKLDDRELMIVKNNIPNITKFIKIIKRELSVTS